MSSQAGLHNPETDFLARWMPCSSRAGVILNPSVDLARSLSGSSWAAQDVDDSFSAQFAPLPYSSNSSSLSVEHLIPDEAAAALGKSDQLLGKMNLIAFNNLTALQHTHTGAVKQESAGDMGSVVESSEQPPEDLMLKLEQLKEWQQQMQEKLKAQQMQQLQQLLEEQQRLLGLVYDSQRASAGDLGESQLTEGDWGADTVLEGPSMSQGEKQPCLSTVSDLQGAPVLQRQPVSPLQWAPSSPPAADLHCHPEEEEKEDPDKTLGSNVRVQRWSEDPFREDDDVDDDEVAEEEEEDSRHAVPSCIADSPQIADRKGEEPKNLQDRPIRPGIGGRSRTFEELLEEQLRMEEQRLNSGMQKQGSAGAEEVRANPKRPFLRRGEGLSRFMGGKALAPRRDSKEVSKPTSTQGAAESASGDDRRRPPVQRKTTVLSREPLSTSMPPNRTRAKMKEMKPGRVPRQPCVPTGQQKLNSMGVSLGRPRSEVKQPQQLQQEVPLPIKSQHAPGQASQVRAGLAKGVEELGGGRQVAPGQEYSLEQSFQTKLESWDLERQRERVELGEFELLEQAAEEMSFSSNSSFVLKVLELDRQDSRGRRHPHRRLSSTPIKSPKPSPPKAGLSSGDAPDRPGSTLPSCPSIAVAAARVDPVEGSGERGAAVTSDSCTSDSEEMEDEPEQEVLQQAPALPSSPCFSPSQGQYDKTSYQDEEGDLCGAGEHGGTDGYTDHNDSTLTEGQGQGFKEDRLVFDDDDTWNDLEDTGNAEDGGSSDGGGITHDPPGGESDRALKRKVATVKVPECVPQVSPVLRELEPPPTSQLVAKLFPSLKPKPQPPPPPAPAPTVTAGDQVTGRQSRLLRERLVELEIEIERFRSENTALASQRQEREKTLEALRKERAEFERMKEEELARLEEFKKEETRKLQKERKLFEKHAAAARAIPDKKEREEIQALKLQLSSLQEELHRREGRWSNTHSRLRQQAEALAEENSALREEVRALERLRVSAWKRDEAERESCRKPCGSSAARSKSTSPPGAVKASQPLTVTARETRRVTIPPRGTQRSSSRKSPPAPSLRSGAQEQDQGQPITAQTARTPPALLSRAVVSQTESFEEEEEEEEEEEQSRKEITHPDGKIETVLRCGTRLIVFPNGTRKEVSADGRTVKVNFFNGDVKQVMEDQRVIYYYANTQTTHTTYPDGMEVLQFPNNQIEKHFPDGRKEITFPDQTVKNLGPNGDVESVLPDGTIIQVKPDGTKVIQFNNGQREVHTDKFKRREYPDGTVKTVYSDGRQETRYPTGRLRIKDKDGRVVVDSGS
ncbi:hypothetical protein COCON_G00047200 [Conger conger]|uniref:Centrosomal P4.1-associated protein n=1 Tax=Conger conger TaxID=82655 RepID=A0A9Q1DUS8_CONCO|nr:hypothetical protein COCON_G00047200 [Conger conger]